VQLDVLAVTLKILCPYLKSSVLKQMEEENREGIANPASPGKWLLSVLFNYYNSAKILPFIVNVEIWLCYSYEILCLRYDTRCYFNVCSAADISELNLPHRTKN